MAISVIMGRISKDSCLFVWLSGAAVCLRGSGAQIPGRTPLTEFIQRPVISHEVMSFVSREHDHPEIQICEPVEVKEISTGTALIARLDANITPSAVYHHVRFSM